MESECGCFASFLRAEMGKWGGWASAGAVGSGAVNLCYGPESLGVEPASRLGQGAGVEQLCVCWAWALPTSASSEQPFLIPSVLTPSSSEESLEPLLEPLPCSVWLGTWGKLRWLRWLLIQWWVPLADTWLVLRYYLMGGTRLSGRAPICLSF